MRTCSADDAPALGGSLSRRSHRAVAPASRRGSHAVSTLVLPPVTCIPIVGELWYAGWAGAKAKDILSRGTSSSSAMSCGRAVVIPCPISDLSIMKVIAPSSSIRNQAFGAKAAFGGGHAGARSDLEVDPECETGARYSADLDEGAARDAHRSPPCSAPSAASTVSRDSSAARRIARRMALYAPQRHTLPVMARSMSSSVGPVDFSEQSCRGHDLA